MTLKCKSTDELVKIAESGGGFKLDCALKSVDDLSKIAQAAHSGGATLILTGINLRSTEDLVQIAAAAKGSVIFEDRV